MVFFVLNRFRYIVLRADVLLAVRLDASRLSGILSILSHYQILDEQKRRAVSPGAATSVADALSLMSVVHVFNSS